ncbi:MAG: hypothetical protein ABS76_06280 [Pelagibacterium sp. SCN 64-44]|nr:MAG: hypothetical protein ABS76_06280 [Pelagibacterium sp. SCN 64-44]
MSATATFETASVANVAQVRSARGVTVEVRDLVKSFSRFTVLDHVDLSIGSGEFVTLLGPSGSGKTTLLMALAGFTEPDAGHISLGGQDVTHVPPERRNIGMVFQSYALFPHMTVADNVAYPLRARRVGRAEIERRVLDALDRVQMGAYADRRPDKLSGGQRQRVALARALVFEPGLLLMDEPLSALDKSLREHMQIEIRALQQRLGITTVSVTHDQREALTMADRIAILHDGRIAQYGTSREVFERPVNGFVASFIGDAVLVPVRQTNGALMAGDTPIAYEGKLASGNNCLVVRADNATLVAEPVSGATNLPGAIRTSSYQGSETLHSVALETGQEVFIRERNLGAPPSVRPQQRVWVSMDARQTLVVPE